MDDLRLIVTFLGRAATASFGDTLLRDTLDASQLRGGADTLYGLRWHFLLGTIPLDVTRDSFVPECAAALDRMQRQWMEAEHRVLSSSARQEVPPVPRRAKFNSSSSDDDEDTSINPLQQTANSSYELQYRIQRVRASVVMDVERMHWNLSFFEEESTRRDIESILLYYCMGEGKDYRQGMHEVTGFLYYVVYRDSLLLGPSEEESALLSVEERLIVDQYRQFLTPSARRAVVFALFLSIMAEDSLGLASWYYCPDASKPEQGGVVAAAEGVQQDILLKIDSQLQHQLDAEYGIQSFTYLVRWLRLLFLREFSFTQSMALWSVIFAEMRLLRLRALPYDLQTSFVVYFAAAMLQYIRNDLFVDSLCALRRLMRYPPVEDIRVIITNALGMSNATLRDFAKSASLPPIPSPSCPPSSTMARQGARLSTVIQRMERKWFPGDEQTEDQVRATNVSYVLAIAELKLIRDVLLHGVEDVAT